jgi:hypothetical protein
VTRLLDQVAYRLRSVAAGPRRKRPLLPRPSSTSCSTPAYWCVESAGSPTWAWWLPLWRFSQERCRQWCATRRAAVRTVEARPARLVGHTCAARLATATEALELTGYPIGSIPPFSMLQVSTLQAIMDSRVLDGGQDGLHVCLSPAELQRATRSFVGEFVMGPAPLLSAPLAPPLAPPPPPSGPLSTPWPPKAPSKPLWYLVT